MRPSGRRVPQAPGGTSMRRLWLVGSLIALFLAVAGGALAATAVRSPAAHAARAPRKSRRHAAARHRRRARRRRRHTRAERATASRRRRKVRVTTTPAAGTSTAASSTAASSTAASSTAAASSTTPSTQTTADPVLFGDQSVEQSVDSNAAGSAEAFPFTSQTSGTAQSIEVYVDSHNAAQTLVVGIYASSGGQPGARLTSGSLSSPRAGAWNTVPVASASVLAGRTYWIALLGKGGTLYFRDRASGPCDSQNSSQTSLRSLPSTWSPGPSWNTCPTSAYVSGTLASATAPPPPQPGSPGPTISGTAQQGDTLTTTTGSWSNSPTSYAYQWRDCTSTGCTNISGATAASYVLQSSDVGDTVDVVVTASNAGGSSSATSAPTATVTAASAPVSGFSPLHVAGVELQNAGGQDVFLHGVDRSGTEYSCINNAGFFDGTATSFAQEDAQISAMAAWGINAELIPLNEDCWLGINGVPAAYSNSATSPPTPGCSASQCPYANAIENLVKTDEANHIYPVISLMWLAPGSTPATGHNGYPDNSHAPLFWEEVADFFKGDPYVIFRLEQEPELYYNEEAYWQCWSQGDVSYATSSDNTPPTPPTPTGTPNMCSNNGGIGWGYTGVGMQSLVNIVRGTGASNIIALSGLQYANMLSCGPTTSPQQCGMLAPATPPVTDPDHNLIASVDVYPEGNPCGDQLNTSCYDDTYKPVANVMPLIAGETGENPSNSDTTTTTYVDMFMNWMDANANGYFAWAWDTWAGLIPSYTNNSTPTTPWGTDYYHQIHNTTPTR